MQRSLKSQSTADEQGTVKFRHVHVSNKEKNTIHFCIVCDSCTDLQVVKQTKTPLSIFSVAAVKTKV